MFVPSARISRFMLSRILIRLRSAMSRSKTLGPKKYPFPVLPSCPGAGAANFDLSVSGLKNHLYPATSCTFPRS